MNETISFSYLLLYRISITFSSISFHHISHRVLSCFILISSFNSILIYFILLHLIYFILYYFILFHYSFLFSSIHLIYFILLNRISFQFNSFHFSGLNFILPYLKLSYFIHFLSILHLIFPSFCDLTSLYSHS